MGRFQELISNRYNFAGLYALIAVTAGLWDVFFFLLAGVVPLQLVFADLVYGGHAHFGFAIFYFAAPFLLVYLALARGLRIGRRTLVIFPILSILVVLIGGGFFTANAGLVLKLISFCLDGLCLYFGGWRWSVRDER